MDRILSFLKLGLNRRAVTIGFLLAVHLPFTVSAQQDTLKAVEVQGLSWLISEPGTKLTLIDSSRIHSTVSQDLSQLLANTTPAYFKNYGAGGLASISLRGTSANHTALMWNSIKIQLPSLQQTDYAILPAVFWDEIGVQYGPSIDLNGADIAGGAIHLVNNTFRRGFSAKYLSQFGSFGFQQQAFSISYGKKQLYARTQFNYKSAENDFTYTHPSGEEVTQQNAALEQVNFLQQINWKFKNVTWKNSFWYGNNDREIPHTIIGNISSQLGNNQQDAFYRINSSLTGRKDDLQWEFNYAFFKDELVYNGLENYSQQHIYRGYLNYQVNKNTFITGGGQVNENEVETSSYQVNDKLRTDYFIKATTELEGWKLHGGFKQVFIKEKNAPFIPSLGFEKPFAADEKYNISISGKVARHFRYPTFNDLYWNPGGNPDLKPENGWSSEGSVLVKIPGADIVTATVTYFNLQVNDWILWKPIAEQNYWVPENVWRVNSHGVEYSINSFFTILNIPVELNLNYSFTKSINKSFEDKQLIYIPVHQANFFLHVLKNGWFFTHRTGFTGKRYTTQDNRESGSLPSYVLLDFSAGYNYQWRPASGSIQLEVDNILNTDYQTLKNRAMPGRNFQLQLLINI